MTPTKIASSSSTSTPIANVAPRTRVSDRLDVTMCRISDRSMSRIATTMIRPDIAAMGICSTSGAMAKRMTISAATEKMAESGVWAPAS